MNVFMVILLSFQVIYCDWSEVGSLFSRFGILLKRKKKNQISQEPKEVNYFFKRTECSQFNPKFIDKPNCTHKFGSHFKKYSSFECTIHPGIALDKIYVNN